jgi:hypothetical protein
VRARAAPAAQSHRLGASFPDATTVSPGPAANRSPGGARAAPAAHTCRLDALSPADPTRRTNVVVVLAVGVPVRPRLSPSGLVVGRGPVRVTGTTTPSTGTTVRLAPPAPSRAAAGACSLDLGDRFRLPPQVTCAQPCGLPRCTSARGTRRCRWVRLVVLCAQVCSAGTRRCPVLPSRLQGCTIVQRRVRTQFDAHVNTRPPWSVWPGTSSRMVTKPG